MPERLAMTTCPEGHTVEDFASALAGGRGWCPTCDAEGRDPRFEVDPADVLA